MSRCRDCGDLIAWRRTRAGKSMPVEGEESEEYYLALDDPRPPRAAILTADGDLLRGRVVKATDSGVVRVEWWESHFERCVTKKEGSA